jgi:putative tributyrin esterase
MRSGYRYWDFVSQELPEKARGFFPLRPKPRLYQCCGTEDPLYTQNTRFRDAVQELGFDYLYEEGPGDHSWAYWDKMIARTLTWLEQG